MDSNGITTSNIQTLAPTTEPEVIKKNPRRRRIIIFTVITILNVALITLLAVLVLTPRADLPPTSASTGLGDISSPLLGKAAPDFTLPILAGNGSQLHLASLKGKPVVINFWEASCIPCNDEAPFMQRTATTLASKGTVLLGIDGGPEKTSDALTFLQKYAITYTNVKDSMDGATAINFGATGNPETFFIDQHGIVRARWIGPLKDADLKLELAKIQVQ